MTDVLDIQVSGSGDVWIDTLVVERVEVGIGGSGKVSLAGTATEQNIDVDGSGNYRAGNLQGESVDLTISGSGDAVVWATERFDGRISGSGSVKYYGLSLIHI